MRPREKGQSLFEILIAISIAAIIVTSAATAMVVSLRSGKVSGQAQKGYAVLQDTLSKVRTYAESDWASFYNFSPERGTPDQKFYFANATTTPTSTTLSMNVGTTTVSVLEDDVTVIYTTWFVLENMYRDDANAITTSPLETEDPSTLRATAYATWDIGGGTIKEISLSQQISRVRSDILKFSQWGGASGVTTPTDNPKSGDYVSIAGDLAIASGGESLYAPVGGVSGSVTVTESGGSTDVAEGSTTDTYTVVLDNAPTDDVDITVSDDSQVNVDEVLLTFTTGNWSTPQTVTVSAENDAVDEENPHSGGISHTAASNDSSYDGIFIDSVSVTITDNDPENWYNSNWAYRKDIIIEADQVSGTANLENFPVLISRTDVDWKSVANNGHIAQADGGDILFTSSGGLIKLDHEIESYDPSTGALIAWVEVPALDYDDDTTIYIYYGNDTGGLTEWNIAGTWSANYKAVYHLNDNAATQVVIDSTLVNEGWAARNTNLLTADGKIGKALVWNGTSDYVFDTENDSSLDITGDLTITGWVNPSDAYANDYIISKLGSSAGYGCMLWGGKFNAMVNTWDVVANTTYSAGAWAYFAWNKTGANSTTYKNGAYDASWSNTPTTITTNDQELSLGYAAAGPTYRLNGYLDEVRVSNHFLSGDWIATEYANQSSPATFYSVGNEGSS